jgi:hypothetical protein
MFGNSFSKWGEADGSLTGDEARLVKRWCLSRERAVNVNLPGWQGSQGVHIGPLREHETGALDAVPQR